MASKQEQSLYPTSETLPGSPPQYDRATAPPIQGAYTQEPQSVVYVQQAVPGQVPLGPRSTRVTCPSCHATQNTNVTYQSSTKTHLIAVVLLITTCCCCIPYCMDSCKNANHNCAQCGAYLGTYSN